MGEDKAEVWQLAREAREWEEATAILACFLIRAEDPA